MATNAVMGHVGKWSFEDSTTIPSAATFDGSSRAFQVISDTVGRNDIHTYQPGMQGSRSRYNTNTRTTRVDIEGTLVVEVSPKWLDFIIPHITGDSVTPFTPQSAVGDGFDYIRYDGIAGKSHRFDNCIIRRTTLNFNGEFVTMSLDISAMAESEVTYAGEDLTRTIEWEPYLPSEMVFNAGNPAADRSVESLQLIINPNLQPRRRMQLTPTCYLGGTWEILLESDAEWGSVSEAELYGLADTGFAASITLTRENMSSAIAITKLQIPDSTPGITTPDEIMYPIRGVCFGTAPPTPVAEFSWTNDSVNT